MNLVTRLGLLGLIVRERPIITPTNNKEGCIEGPKINKHAHQPNKNPCKP